MAGHWPSLLSERVPFPRVFDRAFMTAGIIAFILARRLLIPAELKTLLGVKLSSASRNLFSGFVLSVVSMTLLVALMAAIRVFTPYFRLPLADSLSQVASALAAGIFAGTLEEIFFRGILFFGLRKHGWALRAYVLANLFYRLHRPQDRQRRGNLDRHPAGRCGDTPDHPAGLATRHRSASWSNGLIFATIRSAIKR